MPLEKNKKEGSSPRKNRYDSVNSEKKRCIQENCSNNSARFNSTSKDDRRLLDDELLRTSAKETTSFSSHLNDRSPPSQVSTKISEGTDTEISSICLEKEATSNNTVTYKSSKPIQKQEHNTDSHSVVHNKEVELLKTMGWGEEDTESDMELDQTVLAQLQEKFKALKASREKLRKDVKEKFKTYIQGSTKQ